MFGVSFKGLPWGSLRFMKIPPSSHMDVSEKRGTPKSSILIGFTIINHPFWGFPPIFWFNTHIHNPHVVQIDLEHGDGTADRRKGSPSCRAFFGCDGRFPGRGQVTSVLRSSVPHRMHGTGKNHIYPIFC